MAKSAKSANAGVNTGTGIEFQKHCALYLLLENYHSLKDKKYFICIEHHDDFLFCYQTSENHISSVEAFQAKKSSNAWKISAALYEILKKLVETGEALVNDSIQKTDDYQHSLHFITNNNIHLEIKGKKDAPSVSTIINEANSQIQFLTLNQVLQDKLRNEVELLLANTAHINQLEFSTFVFIDLTRTSKNQVQQLIAKFGEIFGQDVSDHKAAVKILMELFREVELTHNQNGQVKLLDESKRVDSVAIQRAIGVITTQQRAYDLWKSKKDVISTNLAIPLSKQTQFKLDFVNSLDLFKDLKQAEHQKVLKFVEANRNILDSNTHEQECIKEFYSMYIAKNNSQLEELQLKAAIYAAYVQIQGN